MLYNITQIDIYEEYKQGLTLCCTLKRNHENMT